MHHPETLKRILVIKQAAEQGLGARHAAELLHLSIQRVQALASKYGIHWRRRQPSIAEFADEPPSQLPNKRRHVKWSRVAQQQLIALYNEGLSDSQIARRLNTNPGTIQYHRRKLNLPAQYHNGQPTEEAMERIMRHRRLPETQPQSEGHTS